jgi:protein-histidine pros-kinase
MTETAFGGDAAAVGPSWGESELSIFDRAVVENSMNAVVACDEDGNLVVFNPTARDWHGLDARHLPQERWAEYYSLFLPDGQTPFLAEDIPLARAYCGETVRDVAMVIRAEGQPARHVSCGGGPFHDETGRKRGAFVVMVDTTEQVLATQALRASEERFRMLVEQASDGIFVADATGGYVDANPAACEMLGYAHDELLTKGMKDMVSSEDLAATPIRMDLLLSGAVVLLQRRLVRKDGTVFPAEISARVLPDGLIQGIVRDVTERKKVEDDLQELNESLEHRVEQRTHELSETIEALVEANEAKDRFLRSMSHELRTPLNSVIGFSSMLADGIPGEVNEEQHRQLAMIKNSGKHLLALINDILDLSRIEAGMVEVHLEPIDVGRLLEELCASEGPAAERKGLELAVDVSNPPPRLVSDRTKVLQILLNLLNNAIKFTDAGDVVLRVFAPSSRVVGFAVNDTGPGIALEERETIFGEFERGARLSPTIEGTGLGLAICRGLAGSLGGSVDLVTEVGAGSTFTLTLPEEPGLSSV